MAYNFVATSLQFKLEGRKVNTIATFFTLILDLFLVALLENFELPAFPPTLILTDFLVFSAAVEAAAVAFVIFLRFFLLLDSTSELSLLSSLEFVPLLTLELLISA